ncbi:MAG: hypothetical protein JWL72_961 [Ilumatobacteraceae bacterium]|nr:hypothetical protein [Ilumatobacteraceae bacterium]
MTLTDTVTSFAHDAVSTATDLGSQAVEIGRNAADVGLDAASSVATAAGQLAHSLIHKVPVTLPSKRRSRAPWILGGVLAVLAVGAALARRKTRRDSSLAADQRSRNDDSAPTDEVAAPRHVARVS